MWKWTNHVTCLGVTIIVLIWIAALVALAMSPDFRAVRRLGFRPASTLQDAFELAEDVVGPSPTITHFHNPPLVMADVS